MIREEPCPTNLDESSSKRSKRYGNPADPHDKDHQAALREVEALWGSAEGSAESDRLNGVLTLIEVYEDCRWPIVDIDQVEILNLAESRES